MTWRTSKQPSGGDVADKWQKMRCHPKWHLINPIDQLEAATWQKRQDQMEAKIKIKMSK